MDTGRRGFLKVLGLGTAATAATAVAQVAAEAGPTDPLDGATYLGAIDLISARADGTGEVMISVDLAASSKDELPPICLPSSKFPDFLDAHRNRLGGSDQRKSLRFTSWKDLRESVLGFNPAIITGSHTLMGSKVYLRPEIPLG